MGTSGEYMLLDVGATADAFERLQAGARAAIEARAERVLIDLAAVDPVDGAMLAVLARMVQSLSSSARVALVVSNEVFEYFAEWRLDSMWLLAPDRQRALDSLMR